MCVCVCVCVCGRQKDRQTDRQRGVCIFREQLKKRSVLGHMKAKLFGTKCSIDQSKGGNWYAVNISG